MLISRKNQIIKLLRYSVVCVNGEFYLLDVYLPVVSLTLSVTFLLTAKRKVTKRKLSATF